VGKRDRLKGRVQAEIVLHLLSIIDGRVGKQVDCNEYVASFSIEN
jgi:hypothetical protein